jgi:hypothetical protein
VDRPDAELDRQISTEILRCQHTSLENLRSRTAAFIEYFNDVLAKPFRWTYTGRPLQA